MNNAPPKAAPAPLPEDITAPGPLEDEPTAPAGPGPAGPPPSSSADSVTPEPPAINSARIEALARTALANGLVQLVTHFPTCLQDLELEAEETLQQAWRLAEEALELAPTLPDPYVLLARLVLMHESPEALEDALDLTERALSHDGEHDPAGVARAAVLWRRGEPEAALGAVNEVLGRGNMLPQPLLLRALLHAEAGREADARRDLERAVALAPESGLLRLDAAAAAERQGDADSAERHRRRAESLLGPSFPELSQLHRIA